MSSVSGGQILRDHSSAHCLQAAGDEARNSEDLTARADRESPTSLSECLDSMWIGTSTKTGDFDYEGRAFKIVEKYNAPKR
ncbi:MAG: hypothetical protein K2Z81_18070 [Cyanobacteria bacterium]|nr:hypothetical protein [Cyanobacteriota bacterium]